MNALELMKQDHRRVTALFNQFEETQDRMTQKDLFAEIKDEFEAFTNVEETLVYPTLGRYEGLQEVVREAYEEHRQAKILMREIERLIEANQHFDHKLKMLGDNLEQQFEEEENVMFTRAKRIFNNEELEWLGEDLEIAKERFQTVYQKRSTAAGGRADDD